MHENIIGNKQKILGFVKHLGARKETFYVECEDQFYANFVVATVCEDLGFNRVTLDDFWHEDPLTVILQVGQQRTLLRSKKTNVLVVARKPKKHSVDGVLKANKQAANLSGFTINTVRIVVVNSGKAQAGDNVIKLQALTAAQLAELTRRKYPQTSEEVHRFVAQISQNTKQALQISRDLATVGAAAGANRTAKLARAFLEKTSPSTLLRNGGNWMLELMVLNRHDLRRLAALLSCGKMFYGVVRRSLLGLAATNFDVACALHQMYCNADLTYRETYSQNGGFVVSALFCPLNLFIEAAGASCLLQQRHLAARFPIECIKMSQASKKSAAVVQFKKQHAVGNISYDDMRFLSECSDETCRDILPRVDAKTAKKQHSLFCSAD